ncbi:MAG: hypothetical protein ILP14_10525, partial [Oscillospiraceae bacterium]|nr:hypothetical protein [Oscillospiraceae bacterium]
NESLVTLITGHAEITCFEGDVVSIEAGQQVRIVRQDDGSCDDQYVEFTEEQEAEMLRDREWIREEHHGAIWEALNDVGGLKRNGVGDNQIPVSNNEEIADQKDQSFIPNIDYPGDDVGPDGPFSYIPYP